MRLGPPEPLRARDDRDRQRFETSRGTSHPFSNRPDAGTGLGRRPPAARRPAGQRHGRRWLPARDPRGDDRTLPRAGRRGCARDRTAGSYGPRSSHGHEQPHLLLPGIDTLELVVDRDRLYANVLGLQRTMDERGIRLRPHAKTHKSVLIGRLQVEAGAVGLTVGTLGEAEVFALAGLRDIFVAYPVWPRDRRRNACARSTGRRTCGSGWTPPKGPSGWEPRKAMTAPRVLVDPGLHRTGVADAEAAVEVAQAAKGAGHVEGVFAHAGHSYTPGRAGAASLDEVSTLEAARGRSRRMASRSKRCRSTDAVAVGQRARQRDPCRDLRPRRPPAGGPRCDGSRPRRRPSSRPRSCRRPGIVRPRRGAKALTKDRPDWLPGFGEVEAYPDVVIEKLSDYHGVTRVPPLARRPGVGEAVAVVPNHICPVVDLFSSFTVVAPDGRVERWPVDARGRSG